MLIPQEFGFGAGLFCKKYKSNKIQMKKLYSLLSVAFISVAAFAQNPVLNPGFENWSGSNPSNWTTSNSSQGNPITKATPGYSSASAAKLTAIATAGGTALPLMTSEGTGFSVTHAYSNLELWYKAAFVASDVCNVTVSFLDASNNAIGGGAKTINTNTTTFTHVTVPLTVVGTPAKCQITFTVVNPGGGIVIVNLGSTITLDDIELTGVIGIDELKENSDLAVYPNPVHDRMLMQVTTTPGEKITWSLTDASGKVVATRKSEIVSSDILKDEMQLPQLAKGFYILSLQSDTRRATRRVVIE